MIASWSNDYIGIPYKLYGRTKSGADCWGIVRLVLHNQAGIYLPSFCGEYLEASSDFARIIDEKAALLDLPCVEKPEILDIVLINIRGLSCHVGIYVGNGYMIHTLAGSDSALVHVSGPKWRNRIEGFYRAG